jgi:hypothetical protein
VVEISRCSRCARCCHTPVGTIISTYANYQPDASVLRWDVMFRRLCNTLLPIRTASGHELIVSRAALVYAILMLGDSGNPANWSVNLMNIIFATAKLLVLKWPVLWSVWISLTATSFRVYGRKLKTTMKIGMVELGLMQEWFIFVKLSKRTM